MHNRRKLHSACFCYKIIETYAPPWCTDLHNLSIRKKTLFSIPMQRKQLFKRSFSNYISIVVWLRCPWLFSNFTWCYPNDCLTDSRSLNDYLHPLFLLASYSGLLPIFFVRLLFAFLLLPIHGGRADTIVINIWTANFDLYNVF